MRANITDKLLWEPIDYLVELSDWSLPLEELLLRLITIVQKFLSQVLSFLLRVCGLHLLKLRFEPFIRKSVEIAELLPMPDVLYQGQDNESH